MRRRAPRAAPGGVRARRVAVACRARILPGPRHVACMSMPGRWSTAGPPRCPARPRRWPAGGGFRPQCCALTARSFNAGGGAARALAARKLRAGPSIAISIAALVRPRCFLEASAGGWRGPASVRPGMGYIMPAGPFSVAEVCPVAGRVVSLLVRRVNKRACAATPAVLSTAFSRQGGLAACTALAPRNFAAPHTGTAPHTHAFLSLASSASCRQPCRRVCGADQAASPAQSAARTRPSRRRSERRVPHAPS